MIFHDIVIDNFKGIEHLEIHDLPDRGVVVITGDNEAGKSTIMDAVHLLLTTKHTGSAKDVKAAQPVGRDVGPRVSVTMSLGGHRLTMTKQWLRLKSAELTVFAPAPENVTGRAADERFEEILDAELDRDLFSATFLRQNELEPALAAAGIPSLARALDAADGGTGTEAGQAESALVSAAEKELERYQSLKTAKPSKQLKAAQDAVEATGAELARARAAVRDLDGYLDRFEAARRDCEQAGRQLPQARKSAEERAGELSRALEARQAAEKARAGRDAAAKDAERARADVKARETLTAEVETRAGVVEDLQAGLSEKQAAADAEKATVDTLAAALGAAEDAEKTAAAGLERARGWARRARLRETLAGLERRVAAVDKRRAAVAEARAAVPDHRISAEAMERLEQTNRDLTTARAVAEARAAKLRLAGPAGASVDVDGKPVELAAAGADASDGAEGADGADRAGGADSADRADGADGAAEIALNDGTRVRIGEITATFVAAAGSANDGADDVERLERRFGEQLAEAGVEDLDAARELRRRCEKTLRALEDATRSLRELLAGDDPDELRAERDRAARELAERAGDDESADGADTDGADAGGNGEQQVTAAQAEAAVEEAEAEAARAGQARQRAQAELEPWRDKTAAVELAGLTARLESARGELEAARARLAAGEEQTPSDRLAEAVAAADAALEKAAASAAEADEKLRAADPEGAADRAEAAQARVESLEKRHRDAELTVTEMRGRVDSARGAEEKLAVAEDEAAAAEQRLAVLERRRKAAGTLVETLHRHRDEARARYARPFARELDRLTRGVFGPEATFELGEDLAVTARTVDGRSVDVGSLSGGAQEQLMILVRLAVARLAGGGEGLTVPVFVDDALGNTDAERLERMGTVLNRLGREGQVFVLTCMPGRYDSVAEKKELPMSRLKENAPAALDL